MQLLPTVAVILCSFILCTTGAGIGRPTWRLQGAGQVASAHRLATNQQQAAALDNTAALGHPAVAAARRLATASPNSKKLILLYDHFYDASREFVPLDFTFDKCAAVQESTECMITKNKTLMADADAVWFFEPGDGRYHEMRELRTHNPNNDAQYWVWFSMEMPEELRFQDRFFGNRRDVSKLNGYFNLSMTYRQDTNVLFNYGEFRQLQPPYNPAWKEQAQSWFRSKKHNVAWMVSHCRTSSKREDYVKAMRKSIQIDLYGLCHLGDPDSRGAPNHTHFTQVVRSDYKFYIAFENSLCQDYITEKLWVQAYLNNAIPIVRGGQGRGEYQRVAPPGSYIDARDFASPAELGAYINKVANNEELFLSYHQWRQWYGMLVNSDADFKVSREAESHSMCRLCSFLQKHDPKVDKFELDIVKHWTYTTMCNKPADIPSRG